MHPREASDSFVRFDASYVFQILPALQEECAESAKCAPHAKHFAHCEEKVNAGQGFKGEDCVEEL